MDKIVGIDGGKKKKKDEINEWDFVFTMKDGTVEVYRGEFLATNPAMEGFMQVFPKDDGDLRIVMISCDIIAKITTMEIEDEHSRSTEG